MAEQKQDSKESDDTRSIDEKFDAGLSKGYAMVEKGDIREALRLYKELKSLYRELKQSDKAGVFAKCLNFQKILRETYKKLLNEMLDEMDKQFTRELKEEFDALFWGLSANELMSSEYREISARYNRILSKYTV